jgi:hypothetical protein
MFSPRDFLLLAVSFGSLIAGILAPVACTPIQPYPVVFMMLLLFLGFLAIRISAPFYAMVISVRVWRNRRMKTRPSI